MIEAMRISFIVPIGRTGFHADRGLEFNTRKMVSKL